MQDINFNPMDIFEELERLNLSPGKYVVVGSGIMHALGIREAQDIDIVVTPDIFEKCKKEGWKKTTRPNGKPGLEKGIVAIYLDVNSGNYNPGTEELINSAVIINNVPFLSLENLICFKKEYGRKKDVKDIKLIEEYLKKIMPKNHAVGRIQRKLEKNK